MPNLLVVIGDIIGSRDLENREEVQRHFEAAINDMNLCNPTLVSPYTITLGDEFQGVRNHADGLFRDLTCLLYYLNPVKIRFSLAIGNIDTNINTQQAIGMDGPAFHQARNGIELIKKNTDQLFYYRNDNQESAPLIRNSLSMVSHEMRLWKATRFSILNQMLDSREISAISEDLKISTTAVYKNIEAGGLKTIVDLFKAIEIIINKELSNG